MFFGKNVRGSMILLAVSAAQGAIIVDFQSSGPFSAGPVGASPFVQSFQPVSNNIAGVGLYVSSTAAGTGLLNASITTAPQGGTVLASSSAPIVLQGGMNASFFPVTFSNPIPVTPGSTLYLQFSGNLPATASFRTTASNTYAGGSAFNGSNAQSVDYGFQILRESTFVNPIPEPGTIALAGFGLAAALLARSLRPSRK